jgi:uncharacterized membrane protein YjjB (DUF3815 family)
MAEWLIVLQKSIWCGVAAVGFGILFNVPRRTLWIIGLMGMAGGATKFTVLLFENGIVVASLLAAILVGFLSIPAAHSKHSPPMIFAIPSVIPMVPGAFAYRTMLGLINLTGNISTETYSTLIQETINNGLKTLFVLMSLAVGVFFPMLISRRETIKQIRTKSEEPVEKPQ